MSYYEELLTLGQHLQERERVALYEFLLEKEESRYLADSKQLLSNATLQTAIANGEIKYTLEGNTLFYAARKHGASEYFEQIRQTNLGDIHALRIKKILKFMAQAEVEVIWNFPIPCADSIDQNGYFTVSYPFSDLRYYSEGKGRFLGLIKKLSKDDSGIIAKLRAS
jgi:hypothetical protein